MNVPFACALAPPKLDHLSPFRTVFPSPQVSVTDFGRLLALLQLVIFRGDEAKAAIAPTATIAAASARLARRCLCRRILGSSHMARGETAFELIAAHPARRPPRYAALCSPARPRPRTPRPPASRSPRSSPPRADPRRRAPARPGARACRARSRARPARASSPAPGTSPCAPRAARPRSPPAPPPRGRRRRCRAPRVGVGARPQRAARRPRARQARCTEPSCHHDHTSSQTNGRNGASSRWKADSDRRSARLTEALTAGSGS